ncbi:solute carrier family 22 member 16-like [Dermacentor silvarum]|uniref:solute carrier family 22 member 16-like n=1 Tax=Dermacentor silvarum TaxID=543639 RepID=UPI002100EB06|nr:solute carrier family 22 member 16-like [Dermacentor silvarum]
MSSPRSEAARRHESPEEPSWQGDNLSDILAHVGPFHWTMMVYSTFAMIISGLHTLLYMIIRPELVDHWCRLSEAPTNATLEQWKAINIPRQEDGSLSQCLVYVDDGNDTRETRPCSHRSFNASDGTVTIIQEWDLTCDREWLYTTAENAFVLGSFFGLAVSGLSADRVGRKPVVCFCAVVLEVAGFSLYTVENVALFVAFRFILAASVVALAYTNYVMLVEMTTLPRRALYGTCALYGYVGGAVAASVIVTLEHNWRTSQLLVMLPTSVLLCGFWLLPESPRWLITTLRVREAAQAVSLIMRWNRVPPKVIVRISKLIRERPLQMLHRQEEEPRLADMMSLPRRRAQAPDLDNPDKNVWELLVIFITQYQLSTLSLCMCWCVLTCELPGIPNKYLSSKTGTIQHHLIYHNQVDN